MFSRNTTWYMFLAWLWPMCYGFVLLSSAAAGAGANTDTTFAAGGAWRYDLLTSVLLNEAGPAERDVGFQISAGVNVESIWKHPTQTADKLLKIELTSPRLHIKSRKAPTPEGFVEHSSKLEELANAPFLVHWRQGRVQSVYIPMKEALSMVNLKKGIASLFQFQLLDGETNETDSSGHCTISYSSTGPTSFRKTKTRCRASEDTPYLVHPDQLFGVQVESTRQADYKLSEDNAFIESFSSRESHEMVVTMKQDAGNKVQISQQLTHKSTTTTAPITSENIDAVIEQLSTQIDSHFTQETLITERETKMCQDAPCAPLAKLVYENQKNFENKNYGTLRASTGFIRCINAAREANRDEIVKVLKKKQNKNILYAIYDILGSAQTLESHEAAMKQLRFTEEKHLNKIERYLWALSMGSHPRLDVIKDLLNKYLRTDDLGEKLQETLILTIASMTDKYIRTPHNVEKKKIYLAVKEAIYNGIDSCAQKACLYSFIRALKNLRCSDTIPKLLDVAVTGSDKSSVVAMKALRSFPPNTWTSSDVLATCHKIFFQLTKKYDSSARTLALDILLGSRPSESVIRDILQYLLSNDKAYEIKKYTVQKLMMLADKDVEFKAKLAKVVRNDKRINNYSILAQKGMSTALSRQFLRHDTVNGSMISAQEMSSGLVKRGVFDIVLDNDESSCEMFSLGLFSSGLSSFISSDDDEAPDDEVATAGLELTMLGTQIRPFVFFSGQGELMGHVWSGTASDSTTAFQINTLVHDHLEYLRLGPGFIAELNLQTAVSFNLAGEIQISLWNRNSHSLVTQNAAMIMNGLLRVDTSFVQSKVEFTVSTEPKLDLESNIEFASGVAVCLRLKQPSTIYKHNIFKIERIPGSKHRLRKAKYKKFEIPGRTYNLNRKNNEMCNALMKSR